MTEHDVEIFYDDTTANYSLICHTCDHFADELTYNEAAWLADQHRKDNR